MAVSFIGIQRSVQLALTLKLPLNAALSSQIVLTLCIFTFFLLFFFFGNNILNLQKKKNNPALMNEEAMEIIDVSEKCVVLPIIDQEDEYSKRRNE
jgi:TRAP-type C4-dicarboxylate transport system permease small subunit